MPARRRTVALQANVHQGLHGEGFIYAMACAAGFTTSKQILDVDGVDWQIAYPGPKGTTRSPKIEVQVKSWSSPILEEGSFRYRLSIQHYNHLAGPGFQLPRFLALVIVPPHASKYAICDYENMKLGMAAYWLSLADQEVKPTGDDDPRSVVVAVPQRNFLTVEALSALLSGDLDGAVT